MPTDSRICSFGPYRFELGPRVLFRGKDPVPLTPRAMRALLLLLDHPGRTVLKDDLFTAIWGTGAVEPNNLNQVIGELRKKFGEQDAGAPYIKTKTRLGYEWVPHIAWSDPHALKGSQDGFRTTGGRAEVPDPADVTDSRTLLDPFLAVDDGRAWLESLDLASIGPARQLFAKLVSEDERSVTSHIGLASACVLAFLSTRMSLKPDRAALALALQHARRATELDRSSADAWSTLAVVLFCIGERRQAIAAARKAIAIDSHDCRHYLRLAFVSWGGLRLKAASRALALQPGLPLAHWFAATVFVARGAFPLAMEHVDAACASIEEGEQEGKNDQPPGKFLPAVGVYLLRGQLLAVTGSSRRSLADAMRALEREIIIASAGQLFGAESCANAHYNLGGLALQRKQRADARDRFEKTLVLAPAHALARVALAFLDRSPSSSGVRGPSRVAQNCTSAVDCSIAEAGALSLRGQRTAAARLCREALLQTEPDHAGWNLSLDPILHIRAHRAAWSKTLAALRDRAV